MTSPVDTSVKHFFSHTAGAPVLTKAAGSLIALLDACLVLGWGSQAATSVTVAGGVATLKFGSAFPATLHSVILVAGADGAYAALNGEQKITALGNGQVSFATTLPAGNATGAITAKMAPAGWAKVYTGDGLAVYKSTDPAANGHFLRVDDRGLNPGPGYCRVRGYTTMSDIDTGTGLFPLVNQIDEDQAAGGWWPKGYGGDVGTNPIGWSIYADSRIFYYGPQTYQSEMAPSQAANYFASHLTGFGDLKAYRVGGDAWCTGLTAGYSRTGAQSYPQSGSFTLGDFNYGAMFVPRKADGTGASLRCGTCGYGFRDPYGAVSGRADSELGPFPNGIDGVLVYAPRYLRHQITGEADYAPRAEVPGLLSIPQSGVFTALGRHAIIDGEGRWAGRKLYGHVTASPTTEVGQSTANGGITLVDLTGPWR